MRSATLGFLIGLVLAGPVGLAATEPGGEDPALREIRDLLDAGRYEEAERAARAEEARRAPSASRGLADVQDLLVESLWRGGKSGREGTEESARQALALRERIEGSRSPDLAPALRNLANVLRLSGRTGEARAPLERALTLLREAYGDDHPEVAKTLNNLGNLLVQTRDLEEAERRYEEALAIRERILGPDDPKVALILNNLGALLLRTGDRERAGALFERALDIQESALGPTHRNLAPTLTNLGNLQRRLGDPEEARRLYERALAIQEGVLPENHPETARTLNNLAALLASQREYTEAEEFLRRVVAIREEGADPLALAASLSNLANVLRLAGKLDAARPLHERAIEILEAARGPEHPDVARALNNFANLLSDAGDVSEALPLHERALVIRENSLGPDTLETAHSLNNLALLLKDMGDYPRALPLAERALSIKEQVYGPDHLEVARALNGLAVLLLRMGERPRAREALVRALTILEPSAGRGRVETGVTLDHLGILELQEGDPRRAREHLEKAGKIFAEAYAPDHPRNAEVQFNLAEALFALGLLEEAAPLYEKALDSRRKILGDGHPEVARVLLGRARLQWRTGESQAALDSALEAEGLLREHLRETVRSLAEREALAYDSIRAKGLDLALSLSLDDTVPTEATRRAWDQLVRSRGLVLDEMATRRCSFLDETTAAHDELLARLERASSRLARTRVRGPSSGSPEAYRARLQELQEDKDRVERELNRDRELAAACVRTEIGLEAVLDSLPDDSALVSFARFDRIEPSSDDPEAWTRPTAHYGAFVWSPGGTTITFLSLGPVAAIDARITAWYDEVSRDPRGPAGTSARALESYLGVAEALRLTLWDPLAASLGTAERVFLVPDGLIQFVSFAALPARDGYLLDGSASLHMLSAERDLVPEAAPRPRGRGLLVLGAPDFGPTAGAVPARREASQECPGSLPPSFAPLPGAEAEIDQVTELWRALAPEGEENLQRLTGGLASEPLLRSRSPGRRVVHLATHGFYLSRRCGMAPDTGWWLAETAGNESALSLSGLALAGANLRTGQEHEDGVLTAGEAASLDLRGVEWVVLSGCETGVGRSLAGEGVLGLRRAFRMAGAGSLILSLWEIGDADVRPWIRELYLARLGGAATPEALRSAGRAILTGQRRRGRTTHPYLWAAFVASGDWR